MPTIAQDNKLLRAASAKRLLYGPYTVPNTRPGAAMQCAVHGLQLVNGWHGPMQWPRAKVGGHPRLIVCGDLVRALGEETVESVALHWGISESVAIRWRKQLGMPRQTRAGAAIKAAQMRRKRRERPELRVTPGDTAVRSLQPDQRRAYGRSSAGDLAWSDSDLALLAEHGTAAAAAITRREPAAVRLARTRHNIYAPHRDCKCLRCGHQWQSKRDRLPLKCAHPNCRSLTWQRPRPSPR